MILYAILYILILWYLSITHDIIICYVHIHAIILSIIILCHYVVHSLHIIITIILFLIYYVPPYYIICCSIYIYILLCPYYTFLYYYMPYIIIILYYYYIYVVYLWYYECNEADIWVCAGAARGVIWWYEAPSILCEAKRDMRRYYYYENDRSIYYAMNDYPAMLLLCYNRSLWYI